MTERVFANEEAKLAWNILQQVRSAYKVVPFRSPHLDSFFHVVVSKEDVKKGSLNAILYAGSWGPMVRGKDGKELGPEHLRVPGKTLEILDHIGLPYTKVEEL